MDMFLKKVDISMVQGMIVPQFQGNLSKCEEITEIEKDGKFLGKEGEIIYFTKINNGLKYVILVGLGKEEDINGEKVKIAIAKGAKKANELKLKNIGVMLFSSKKICPGKTIKAVTEGIRLSTYTFDKYKSDTKDKNKIESVAITGYPEEKFDKISGKLREFNVVVDSVLLARDLVNEPSNVIYPETLAVKAKEVGKDAGFEVEIFDEKKIEELDMTAFLAVARGSEFKPRFIVMRYFGDKENKDQILGLVGKGITYDTGGYSLKPSDSMKEMKSDMAGAAAVIGVMNAIAKTGIKKNVISVIAACENSISGGSYKPGDIIGSMAGKTIEILNTDAEGRLTLADAVHYIIEKEKVDRVIDIATLTGAALVALGTTTTAVVTNNQEFYNELIESSKKSGENFWQLPSFDEYKKLIKSDIADLKNLGGKYAGTITAGLFIGEFVQNKPWLHLDIAGTSWNDEAKDLAPKGGTGEPVRTLYNLIKGSCGCGCSNK